MLYRLSYTPMCGGDGTRTRDLRSCPERYTGAPTNEIEGRSRWLGRRCWLLRGFNFSMNDSQADPDTTRDLAQRLAFGMTGQDRTALVGIDHTWSSTLAATAGCGVQAVAGLAGDIAAPVLCQGEGQVEDEAALGVLAGRDAVQDFDCRFPKSSARMS
ncbi:hypothetical protein [Nocardia fluminea]|uniref:Uncharacterized protein n=1 Tax=Nocardia fluminea TaxID=134984 RepID=A0A2N3V542_9NOCA|nr:hypothetical protein [Nocardia fluminea]PKV76743.1 hypothetical protein ATK86_7145 [Nocardia fluminea]